MKNKGTILFFSIALAVVAVFHLSFTVVTKIVERNAIAGAQRTHVKEQKYLDSIAHKNVYNILVKKYTYAECKERSINLGLDLQGGMHVTLEVEIADLLVALSNNNPDPSFQKALKQANDLSRESQKDYITLFAEAYKKIEPTGKLAAIFSTLENKEEISLSSSNDQVVSFLKTKATSALKSTFEVLRKRIDKFGVTQPNIQLLEGSERIVVELPGVDEPERVRRLLQGSAKLEFWLTYESKDIITLFDQVNKVLRGKLALNTVSKKDSTKNESFFTDDKSLKPKEEKKNDILEQKQNKPETDKNKKDKKEIKNKKGKDNIKEQPKDKKLITAKDTGKKDLALLEDTGSKDTSTKKGQQTAEQFEKENPLYKILRPAVNQGEKGKTYAMKGPVIGFALSSDTALVNQYLSYKEIKAVLPPDLRLAWSAKAIDKQGQVYQLIALKVTTMDKEAPLTGKVVTNARVDVSQLGEREISLSMNAEGAKTWRRLTGENIGKSIAIVLDDLVYSFPTVQTEIAGGQSQITGSFTNAESQDLANILNSGKLDVRVRIIEEAVVGPSLGSEAIRSGLLSILFGLIAVLLFMQFYYNKAGWVANLALFSNIFIIMGVMASLGAALTLPGIAGLVLTMGMSVDSNVLIYERIREELREGKGMRLAIRDGYKMAYSAIIDANSTNFLVSIILVIFGSGPIYGFAVVLAIGILTSLFTSILISRLIFESFLDKEKKINFGNKFTVNLFKNINFDFVGARKYAYAFIGVTLIVGIITFTTKGFDFGVDFKGGHSFIVRFEKTVHVDQLTELLRLPLQGAPEVKTFGSNNQVKITTAYLINDHSENSTQKVTNQLEKGLSQVTGNKHEIMSTEKVGPTIASDITRSSIRAVIFALIFIFLFIFLRFKRWQFGLAAVVCLTFDVYLILTIFSLLKDIVPFSLAIDQTIIAALLTNIGYDNHDTIVVYDRIREKISLNRRKPVMDMINLAINETMSRSIITSFTVFLVMIILFIFGGEIIRGFSFALLIGVVVGTGSSVFVATPIVIEFSKRTWRKEAAALEGK